MTDPSSWGPPAGAPQHQPQQQPSGQWAQPQPQPQPQSGQWAQPEAAGPAGGWQVQQAQQPGGLLLHTKFSPLAFMLYLCSPKVSIDGGEPMSLKWGDSPLPGVAPGRHHVRVWFRYMFYGTCGLAEATVDVPEQGLRLDYKAPTWWVMSKGRFEHLDGRPTAGVAPGAAAQGTAAGQPAAGQAAGAWHPDPTGRAEQRYWDGQQWTGHVVRGGQQVWDPI